MEPSQSLYTAPNPHSHSPGASSELAAAGSARYKLLSPTKLPISRSTTSITIPPGLSPTSFLESPILVPNIKAEPSPTTGSFFQSHLMQGFGSSAAFSLGGNSSNINPFDEHKSNCFEFKPHTGSNSVTGLTSVEPAISSGFYQRVDLREQIQDQHQSFGSLPLANNTNVSASKEYSQCATVNMSASRAIVPNTIEYDELSQRGNSNMGNHHLPQSDHRDTAPLVTPEKSSDDGFNWRKYGQKLVKGCEFPRSYYKCTHPNCEVKKIFERSLDGQIKEIVYKGAHDHPKPQPSRRITAGALMSMQEEKTVKASSLIEQGDYPTMYSQTPDIDRNSTPLSSPRGANANNIDVASPLGDDADADDPFSKRRKTGVVSMDIIPVVKPIREPRVVVQTLSEVDILDDGYRWRKYGQKVVRGNPNPRSYYKCTNTGCQVRKHVERASHDPKAVITTYEGKHNHDVPTARNSSHDMAGPSSMGMSRIRSEDSHRISLDLGVGMNYGAENNTYEQKPTLDSETLGGQNHDISSNLRVSQSSSVSTCYGMVNDSMNMYGTRENHVENRNFEAPSLGHSPNQYPQNLGSVLLGP